MADNHSSDEGVVPFYAFNFNVPSKCEYFGVQVSSKGWFVKENSLRHPLPLLMLQLGAVLLVSSLLHRLLRPLKQPRFVADMLTGILLGPSIIQYIHDESFYVSLFQGQQAILVDILELLCFMYFSFLVGVRTDLGVIRTSGKRAWLIGIATFALPLAIARAAFNLGVNSQGIARPHDVIAVLEATTSFHVTVVLLGDLNLLNSEIGRLALSSSLISNLFGSIFKSVTAFYQRAAYLKTESGTFEQIFWSEASRVGMILFIIIVLRRIMFWMMKKMPEGKPIRESHFFILIIMLFGIGFSSETLGHSASFGAMILGFAVPAGPPLGSGLIDKLNIIISTLLVPSYIIDAGRHVNLSLISKTNLGPLEKIILLLYIGKIVAAALPSLLFKMPHKDALSLGLILSSQGFFDVMLFKRALGFSLISEEMYSIITITAVFFAAIFTPLICYLYDPSKRYRNYRRRTIQHARQDTELRILICLHEEESAFSIMNLLKASCPTRETPLGVYVLDLIELSGREHPVLINHQFHRSSSSKLSRTDRIISSFRHFEFQNAGLFRNQYFTTITPYASMHDDICITALEKSTSLLIIPFQRHESKALRAVKRNILGKAPCSVGFLIDKRIFTNFVSDSIKVNRFHVCVIFSGGPDSREALAYAARMVESPNTRITVIQLIAEDEFIVDLVEAKHDLKMINDCRSLEGAADRIDFREVCVKDGAETSSVLMSLDDNFDFILVGKRIDKESSMVSGLIEWNNEQIEELGIIGDILASPDMKSKASVLVLQQQSTVEDLLPKWQTRSTLTRSFYRMKNCSKWGS